MNNCLFLPLVSHQPVPLDTKLVSDQGPPELLLLSEESGSRAGSGNDRASLESSNASSVIPLLPSLGAADAHSESQTAHADIRATDFPAGREALTGGGDVKECGDYKLASSEPPSSYTKVGQSESSVPIVGQGDQDGDLPHPNDTIPQTLHLSTATGEGNGVSGQTFKDPQQV